MTIAAREWIEASSIDAAIFERWPDYRAVLVASDAVTAMPALGSMAEELLARATAHAAALNPAEPDRHVALWHDAYRDFGVKPRVGRVSVDALIRRAASEAGLPSINVLVDLYNAVSVLRCVPIGGEDLDRYEGAARLTIATGDEQFVTSANGEPVVDHPEAGEPVWVDDGGVTCRRWNWRQTSRTAIRADTRRVGFIVDSLDAPLHEGAEAAARELAELLCTDLVRTIDRASQR